MAGTQQVNHGLLRFQINGIPFGLLRRKFSTDVEGACDVHSQVIKISTVIKDHETAGGNLLAIVEVVPGIQAAPAGNNRGVGDSLCSSVGIAEAGARLNLIFKYPRVRMSDGITHGLSAQFA